jgi:membrane fusion protein, multidrug efflux system
MARVVELQRGRSLESRASWWWRAVVSVALFLGSCGPPESPPEPPSVVVEAIGQREVRVLREFIGTTEGEIDAEVRPQISGYLLSRDYREGTLVKASQLLFEIDARPFRASLDQARGELGRAAASLAKAKQDVARFTPLAREGAVSQQELDNAVQAARAGAAAVDAAEAVVQKAQVELGFTRIASPIDGLVGVSNVQIGDLVDPANPKALTTVSQIDPIVVATPISERDYLRIAERIRASLEQGPRGDGPQLELVLADGSVHPHQGRVVVVGREVDPSTGTILLKSAYANPELTVRPGQYARVRVAAEVLEGALVVPQRAITEMQGTHQVAVLGPDDVVEMRVVELGPRDGSDVVIQKGIAPNERVVVEGIQKVRDGTKVAPQAAVGASSSAKTPPLARSNAGARPRGEP